MVSLAVRAVLATGIFAAGGGGGGSWPTTADKYVSSSGSNGAGGTIGAPYATVAFALSQISPGQSVMVLSNITENINAGSLSAGTAIAFKRVVAQTPGLEITGTFSGSSGSGR